MISKFFIERPRFAMVVSIVITLCGLIAMSQLPVALYPQITPPEVVVTASYPGASADIVKKTVIEPIESQINGVKDMIYISSSAANDGSASITVTFNIGTDSNMNVVNVQNRVSVAAPQLPDEVKKIGVVVSEKSSNMLMVINLISPEKTYDEIFLNNYALINVRDALLRIPGVGAVQSFGSMDYSMRIWLDPDRLASLKMTVAEVIEAINEQNVQVAAGQIGGAPISDNQQFQYTILTKGRLSSVEEFKEIIIRSKDGSDVRIKDVARVELGSKDYSSSSTLNGVPCSAFAVYQRPEANALEITKNVKAEMKKLHQRFPKDLEYEMAYDTTRFIDASLYEVKETLVIAIILVILVVFIFLQDWRSTLIPSIAIPVSLIGTFAVMLALGFSINLTTLFGLILAIGIVVDDAIIIIENVHRLMKKEHLPVKEAVIKTMEQVTRPIISTTLVLLSVFVPVCFLPGITGELYRQFALTISISVFISAVNALSLSPALCAVILREEKENTFIFFRWFNSFFEWLTNRYSWVAEYFVRRSVFTAFLFIILMGCTYFIYKNTPTGFIPTEDQGFVMVDVQLPDAAALPRTEKLVKEVTGIIKKTPGVNSVMAITGYSMLSGSSSSNSALVIAILDDWSKREKPELYQENVLGDIYMKIAGISSAQMIPFTIPSIPGLGTTGGFEFMLQDTKSDNPQTMAAALGGLLMKANQSPDLDMVYSTYRANVPQFYLDIDREKVKKLGLNLAEIFTTLQAALGSMYINDFNKFGKVYQVKIQAEKDYRRFVQDISNLYVRNQKGSMVPLETVLSIRTVFGPQLMKRYNLFPAASINGSAAPGYSSGQAMKAMEKIAKETLPDGMTFEWTGMSYQEIIAGSKQMIIFALCLLFAYLFLVAQYESWMLPLAVIFSVPVAFFGALIATWLAGLENNIYTQIGFVLLIGLAAKTAILIVEFAMEQHTEGKEIIEAALFAANLRFRAVCMTAFAFILGVLPLVISVGAGAASRRSLGSAVFGGMIAACIIGTIVIPSFYVIIQKTREWTCGKKAIR